MPDPSSDRPALPLDPMFAAAGLAVLMVGAVAQSPQVLTHAFEATSSQPVTFRDIPALTFDATRDRLVGGDALGRIQEWDGTSWASGPDLPGPAVSGAYDPGRRTSWFITAPTATPATLFAYDGRRIVDRGPVPDAGIAVMDTARSRLVLFADAGLGQIGLHEWDGLQWRTITTSAGPPPQSSLIGAAFDSARATSVVVLLVFDPQTRTSREQIWEWNGAAWSGHASASAVGAEHESPAFDPVGQRVVAVRTPQYTGTAAWTGTQWVQVTASDPFPARRAVHVTDPRTGRVLRIDEIGDAVWAFDGAAWGRVGETPHPRSGAAFVFDEQRRVALAIDSAAGTVAEWNGTGWTTTIPTVRPPARVDASVAYDAARGETIVFGGMSPSFAPLGDTWAWNGSWRQVATIGPSPRARAPMAFDRARNRMVLVGGYDGNFISDQWEWDGSAWTQTSSYVPFLAFSLAYDESRNVLVALGDEETLEWTGTWTQRLLHIGRGFAHGQLAWDASRQRVVGSLYAPYGSGGSLIQLCEWDGAAWRDVELYDGSLAFDRHRGTLLGFDAKQLVALTAQPSSAFDQGRGCGGSEEPSLSPFGRPRIANRAFQLDLFASTGNRVAAVVLSFAPANTPLTGGCAALVGAPAAIVFGVTDAFGQLRTPLPIPDRASLRGLAFFAQGVVLAPAQPLGVALSAGLRLVVGD